MKTEWVGYSNDGNTEPPTPERMPANVWPINVNSRASTKIVASQKGSTGTNTADGEFFFNLKTGISTFAL